MRSYAKSFNLFCSILVFASCIDRVDFALPQEYAKGIVVDGQITDQPGPYSVKLSRSIKIDGPQILGQPVSAKSVVIYDDLGNSELLQEQKLGHYQTQATGMRGTIGRSYFIRIETYDGKIYESLPDRMEPGGTLDSVYMQLDRRQDGLLAEDGYRIYVDARSPEGSENFFRWKFGGTYIVETKPQEHWTNENCPVPPCGCPAPLPCSGHALINGIPHLGYIIDKATGDPVFVQGLKCECCRCWVSESESVPTVSDNKLVQNGHFRHVEVGFVPLTYYRFQERYRVELTQESLTVNAFEFWKSLQAQKEGVNSLFQPVSGIIPISIKEKGGEGFMQGIFYASSTSTKYIYLDKSIDRVVIPEPINCTGRVGPKGESCLSFPGASTQPPSDWN